MLYNGINNTLEVGIMGIFKKIKRKINTFHSVIKPLSTGKWDCFVITVDYLYCRYLLKVPQDEYLKYNFYNLKGRYRKQFILQDQRKKFVNLNTRSFTVSKYVFYKHIPDLFSREMILAPHCGADAFVEFLKKHERIVIKPDKGSLGKGIEVIAYTDDEAAKKYFAGITNARPMVCEQFIHQHSVLKQLNPSSVNTIRIVSFLNGDEVEILAATLKTGAGAGHFTDNLSLGGIGAQIDVPTGIVCTFGKDFDFNTYTHHPASGAPILGLQIPHWDIAIDLVKTAHKRLPQCLLYGWDIAITETGADIVEANSKPGSRIMQVMDGVPKGQKVLPMMKKDAIKDKRAEYTRNWAAIYNEYYG